MKSDKLNAIATSVIAYVTISSLIVGLYYNLKILNFRRFYIIVFELLFIGVTFLLTWWLNGKIKNE
ncbi:hypothetical protein HYX16_06460 [Candidatus Woesearchaeota archaeon]|nr:hypothetical protein [Candidatus Woesearchaeota archaeon]